MQTLTEHPEIVDQHEVMHDQMQRNAPGLSTMQIDNLYTMYIAFGIYNLLDLPNYRQYSRTAPQPGDTRVSRRHT